MRSEEHAWGRVVAAKVALKRRAQRHPGSGVWFGLGMFGVIGWSVTIPTVVGALLGAWWDRHHNGPHPLTLALLVAGLVIGCANAWHWITAQNAAMAQQDDEP